MKANEFAKIVNSIKTAMENDLVDKCKKLNIGAMFFPGNLDTITHTTIDDSVEGHQYIKVLGFKITKYGICLFTENDNFNLEEADKEELVKVWLKYILLTPADADKYDEMFATPIEDSCDPTECLLSLHRAFEETIELFPDPIKESVESEDYTEFIPTDKNGIVLKVGDKVKWIDPATSDYETEEEYHEAINRVFEIFDIDTDTEFISITNGTSEAEVFDHELIKVGE